MKTLFLGLALSGLFFHSAVYGCIGDKDGYFPENNWKIPVKKSNGALNDKGITENDFTQIISDISEIYSPIISQMGGNLEVRQDWNDPTVNAYASREGANWIVKMFGGLARHGAITKDGFALVMCHEVGHHIGGAPKYPGSGNSWASNEGQSDYFAGTKCLRKYMMNQDNENIVRQMNIDPSARAQCESLWSNGNDQAICMRIAMAGFSTTQMFAQLSGGRDPDFDQPDPTVVSSTLHSHPPYQCRLDTYFDSGLCLEDEMVDVSQSNPNIGTCYRGSQYTQGFRPLCWYKPNGNFPDPTPLPTVSAPTPIPTIEPPSPPTPFPTAPPNADIASMPMLNGLPVLRSTNPNVNIPIQIDVRNIPGAYGVYIEVSKPNTQFSNPNGISPDRINGLGGQAIRGTAGILNIVPIRSLPGWGAYQFRVIALDPRGRARGKFSNPSTLILQP